MQFFIQDTVWQSLAHPAALRKKSATIYEVDCIKDLELHLDRDTLNIAVKIIALNIEFRSRSLFKTRGCRSVCLGLLTWRIGLRPDVHQLYYSITISDETVYQDT